MEEKYIRKIYGTVLLLLGAWVLSRLSAIFSVLGAVTDTLFPIFLGLFLAFLLNLPLRFFEGLWDRIPTKKWRRGRRAVCLTLTVFLVVGILLLLVFLILPRLMEAVSELLGTIPQGIDRLWAFAERWSIPLPAEKPNATEWREMFKDFLERYGERLAAISVQTILNAVGGIFDLVVAIALSLYVLAQKEKLGEQSVRFLRAVFSQRTVKGILRGTALVSQTFSRFFAGQVLEASILGGLCFLGMWVMGMPFALLISVIVGVTALVPVFGAFAGGALGALLILSVSPIRALWFLVFLIVLQQLEDSLIYPRLMGRSVGLPGVWVLSAVIVGSSLGLGWIFISVPVVSVLYTLLREFIQRRQPHRE